jgi:hypothetical protein
MRWFIFAFTFVATTCYAAQHVEIDDKKMIDELRISVAPDKNSTPSVEFRVPVDFLKLCRFLMYANSMSRIQNSSIEEEKNHQSLVKSFTPLVINNCQDTGLRKCKVLVNKAFKGRNVVVTSVNHSSRTGRIQCIIICTGIGVLYTFEEKKQLEALLDAEVLDILDIAYWDITKKEKEKKYSELTVDKMRDNLIYHSVLLKLKQLVENAEVFPDQSIENLRLKLAISCNLNDQADFISKKTALLKAIKTEIEKCLVKSKESLKKIRELICTLKELNRKSSKDKDRKDIGNTSSFLDFFSDVNINYNANIDNFVSKITTPATSPLGGFVDDDDVNEAEHKTSGKPYDKATRHISDMLHSEALYIYWYQCIVKDEGKDTMSNTYFFTQRDMCQSCDDRVAEWMTSVEKHPQNLLVLSAQMCNRPLAASADCNAVLALPEHTKEGNLTKEAENELTNPQMLYFSSVPTLQQKSIPDGSARNRVIGTLPDEYNALSTIPLPKLPRFSPNKYRWKLKYPYHPARLQSGKPMVPGLIRIRVPALTRRRADEYKSPEVQFADPGSLPSSPGQEQVRIATTFYSDNEDTYYLSDFFPKRADIATATYNDLNRLAGQWHGPKRKEPANVWGFSSTLFSCVCCLGKASITQSKLPSEKTQVCGNAFPYVFSYGLKLLDVYSDVFPDMLECVKLL